MDAGSIGNTATAAGSDPKGEAVTGTDDATVTTETADPSIEVTKAADKTEGAAVGDVITYTITVKNTGNVTLSGVEVDEQLAGVVEASALSPTQLAPGGEATASYTYTVTQADVDAGQVVNDVTATGNPTRCRDISGFGRLLSRRILYTDAILIRFFTSFLTSPRPM